MKIRTPRVAGAFYPESASEIRRQINDFLQQADVTTSRAISGGILPHAGWTYSGHTAAHLFKALQQQDVPETVILFGAVHTPGVYGPSLYGQGSWRTPLGTVPVDETLARAILQADDRFEDRPQAHANEHSLEVQIPFIQVLFPEALILPIAIPPVGFASELGRAVARSVAELGRRTVALGSSDLTHYGPNYGMTPAGIGEQGAAWARKNDQRLLKLITDMQVDQILEEARQRRNACGPGAIVATMSYAQAAGAIRGQLLHYTTSHDVMPMGRPTDLVGYGAVAFVGE